jgi:hypothetical protein
MVDHVDGDSLALPAGAKEIRTFRPNASFPMAAHMGPAHRFRFRSRALLRSAILLRGLGHGTAAPTPSSSGQEFAADSPLEESGFEPLVPLTPNGREAGKHHEQIAIVLRCAVSAHNR